MAKEYPEFTETKAVAGNGNINVCDFVEGIGQGMKALDVVSRELARSEVPVLLLAEPGTGKKATAERIHQMSAHREEPFRVVACADMTEPMLGMGANAPGGVFDSGTVYFEELADLSAGCQEGLLSVLRNAEGNGNGRTARARLVCGSARDLEAEVKAGRFREDTYYRVSGVCLRLPPLRQRREDIPLLVKFFLEKYARDFRRPVPQLSQATQHLFQEYAWPGNIRELEDAAKAIVALGDESVAMGGLRSLLMRSERNGNGERISLKQASRAASREAEKELILRVLQRTRWNRRRAAQELQISYKALLYKLKQIGYQDYGAS
jgi:two-component system response regulator AtoC